MHIGQELVQRLLWEPERTKRVPFEVSAGNDLKLLCHCKAESPVYFCALPPDVMPDLAVVTLHRYQHTEGDVWVGKCPHCDIIMYNTKNKMGGTT